MTKAFELTAKQLEAQKIFAGPAKHILLVGGSRSGKSFQIVRNTVLRALKAPNSRHGIFRQSFNACKLSIGMDTFPAVMRLAYNGVPYDLSKTDWVVRFDNGSELWFGGLDDDAAIEKHLGKEFATINLSEISQIKYSARNLMMTRLAQLVEQKIEGRAPTVLKPRMFYDENPPSKAHWSYKLFVQKVDPDTGIALPNPEDYAHFFMNPRDNQENISGEYLSTLESMSGRMKLRFLEGKFGEAVAGALFEESTIELWRATEVPQMVRVVVAVDPSGSGDADNADNDAIGIIVVGLGADGNAYVLEDCTVKAGPNTWGAVATSAFDRYQADIVVGETNYGGAMVNHVIQAARPRTPFQQVTASRGKVARAEPFSSLYEQGKVRHVGRFNELEEELTAFTTYGYVGGSSPNRADALIWGLAALFPAIVTPKKDPVVVTPIPTKVGW